MKKTLQVRITGPHLPSGKTTLQMVIADALRKHGHTVTCSDSANGVTATEFERVVGEHHRRAGERKLNPMDVHIDVSHEDVTENLPIHGTRAQSPNDLKLSDREARRGTCMVGGKAAAEAGAVTCGAVRCSAWLGDDRLRFINGSKSRLNLVPAVAVVFAFQGVKVNDSARAVLLNLGAGFVGRADVVVRRCVWRVEADKDVNDVVFDSVFEHWPTNTLFVSDRLYLDVDGACLALGEEVNGFRIAEGHRNGITAAIEFCRDEILASKMTGIAV
jgi:hypothetical protein